ncbi:hypothetical protein QBC40DRAFT_108322 [Triangularia verruculosa]|uniref:Uncharacterized protein n=1 Tax=Triangularia verruculosa TaxID=2587418 RepID=A0AAN6XB96_9PEZI|nr:hypothetical protein QBC40DRAFT_108322 [Triangularia verruculosa]
MSPTDEELDRDWKPNGRRPQSTIAKVFSEELMNIFRIDNSVADLDEQVDKRKKEIDHQTSELEALERRIREMEERLKGGNTETSGGSRTAAPPSEKDQQKYGGSRPGTARQGQQAVPGALPPTPVESEGEYHHLVLRPHHRSPASAAPPSYAHAQAQTHLHGHPSAASARGPHPHPHGPYAPAAGDADSIKSVTASSISSSTTFADYVIVPEFPDGDRERRQDS